MTLSTFLSAPGDVIHVRLIRVRGSSPREAGAEMFVSAASVHGTIGGGQLEYMAIDEARAMLRGGRRSCELDIPLGPEIGQCCGGRVDLSLAQMDPSDRDAALSKDAGDMARRPHVHVLGAGHVGRALADQFQHLPVQCCVIDSRLEELERIDAQVETRLSAMAEAEIGQAPPGSAFIVLTHDHALDFLLTSAALDRGDAAYVGLIGSATKRVRFERFHAETGAKSDASRLICPIGASGSQDKRPEVIAAFVVAEVMAALTTAKSPVRTVFADP